MLDRFVLHNACRLGHRIAFGSLFREITFLELEAIISRLARALEGLRDYSPSLVAVQAADPWRHWMLLLVLGRLGIATASLPEGGRIEEISSILQPDLFLVHNPVAHPFLTEKENHLKLDENWFMSVLEGVQNDTLEQSYRPVSVAPTDLCRVAIAAGTGREMRPLGYSYSEIEAALLRLIYQDMGEVVHVVAFDNELPDVLCTISPAAMSGFLMVGGALAAATTVRLTNEDHIATEVTRSKGLMAVLTPVHLEHLLKTLPPNMTPLKQLHLSVVGAPLVDSVLHQVYERLTPHVNIVYGTDEAGLVASILASKRESSKSVGRIMPWVSIEIIDPETGAILSDGEEGVVRVRSFGPQSYLRETENSGQNYYDGWFYPGDRGSISKSGQLHLAGRVDDLVALGGAKFDLGVIEQFARQEEALENAAAFVIENSEGLLCLYCAFIKKKDDEDFDGIAFADRIRKEYYPELPPIHGIFVHSIPYTEFGYVDRELLKRSLEAHLKERSPQGK